MVAATKTALSLPSPIGPRELASHSLKFAHPKLQLGEIVTATSNYEESVFLLPMFSPVLFPSGNWHVGGV